MTCSSTYHLVSSFYDLKVYFLDLILLSLKKLTLMAIAILIVLTIDDMTLVGSVTSVVSDSLQCYGLSPTRLLCPWDSQEYSPGKNIGVGCHFLLQVIFATQRSNLRFLHCRQTLYH